MRRRPTRHDRRIIGAQTNRGDFGASRDRSVFETAITEKKPKDTVYGSDPEYRQHLDRPEEPMTNRILIVDDDRDYLEILMLKLKKAGYRDILCVDHPLEAAAQFEA